MENRDDVNTDMRASVIRKYVLWTLGVAALLVSAILSQCEHGPVQRMYFSGVSGQVVDAETSLPIAGAIVSIHWQSQIAAFEMLTGPSLFVAESVTDKDGFTRCRRAGR